MHPESSTLDCYAERIYRVSSGQAIAAKGPSVDPSYEGIHVVWLPVPERANAPSRKLSTFFLFGDLGRGGRATLS